MKDGDEVAFFSAEAADGALREFARSAAATSVVSANSCSLAPAALARLLWISMQYGHCVVSATATAISSLYLSGITPPFSAASPSVALATSLARALGRSMRLEILGHSVGGITYRHYAHRASLAFKAIMTLPQPTAFSALAHGFDGECPCCRRRFVDAA